MLISDRVRRWGAPLGLAALPVVLLLLDPEWVYPGARRDPWLYYGYFRNLGPLLRDSRDLYYASRLSVILPGWLFHALLPPVAANALLHVGLHAAALLSFFGLADALHGRRAALVASVALGTHPFFLVAMGRDHPDAFGIAYLLAALWLLTRAARDGSRGALAAAGATTAALVSANLFFGAFVPFLALLFAVRNARGARRPLAPAAAWFAGGAAALSAALAVCSKALGGHLFYLRPSLDFVRSAAGAPNPFRHPAADWLPRAGWLTLPAAILGASLLLLARKRRGAPLAALLFAGFAAFLLAVQVAHDPVLEYPFYASLLIPFAFLVLAALLEEPLAGLSPGAFAAGLAGAAVLLLLPSRVPLPPGPLSGTSFAAALLVLLPAAALLALRLPLASRLLAFAALFSAGGSLAAGVAALDREFAAVGADRRGAFVQITNAAEALDRHAPGAGFVLWFDAGERLGTLYDPLAATYLVCRHLVNTELPHLIPPARRCSGGLLEPGTILVVASEGPDAPARAAAALAENGLLARTFARERVPGAAPAFTLTFTRLEAR